MQLNQICSIKACVSKTLACLRARFNAPRAQGIVHVDQYLDSPQGLGGDAYRTTSGNYIPGRATVSSLLLCLFNRSFHRRRHRRRPREAQYAQGAEKSPPHNWFFVERSSRSLTRLTSNTARRFELGARDVWLVGENPMGSSPTPQGCKSLHCKSLRSSHYRYAWNEYTHPSAVMPTLAAAGPFTAGDGPLAGPVSAALLPMLPTKKSAGWTPPLARSTQFSDARRTSWYLRRSTSLRGPRSWPSPPSGGRKWIHHLACAPLSTSAHTVGESADLGMGACRFKQNGLDAKHDLQPRTHLAAEF